ncbi:envelope stress response membrane protein PspC [Desulforhopalus sp. IMCC35007]|jgi:phage shock protein C|uniref:envelope stress response membrane protein PspC n=1 Tax=Desulforhopalus sp. IMCC35007 TaxID=2569543 RepID=UPI0010AE1690|nr:envelope stress response membrane protein PspC [Desulforhopalus sp. IMCC35007]TKB12390.1 envelope stress response membrane protein PspC [Desulforhopalus sp. IMCC35007]
MNKYYDRQGGIYRARDGVFLGVCKGISEYFDLSLFWIRMAMVVFFIFSGFWPVIGVYLVAAFFMKPKPVKPITSEEEREFYDSYVHSPKSAAHRLKKKFSDLDRRIRRMEDEVTAREYDWERRFNS